jgi:tRNA (guanine37-N1)-methyltransferase
MKIVVLTLFPNLFKEFVKTSIIKKIVNKELLEIKVVDFRKFSKDKNLKVDDYQIGGGGGMVLSLQPIVDAIRKYQTQNSKVILLSPKGKTFTQSTALKLSKEQEIILIAGRYEGFDERIENYIDETISIGDYVLNGGELPSMIIIEAVARLIENAINPESLVSESFTQNLLDYPVYTKPLNFENHKVPEVLTSGNHKKINDYRKQQQEIITKKYRPDLYKKYEKTK